VYDTGNVKTKGKKAQFENSRPKNSHFLTGIIYTLSKYILSGNEIMHEKTIDKFENCVVVIGP
jgi:hypothetical protein